MDTAAKPAHAGRGKTRRHPARRVGRWAFWLVVAILVATAVGVVGVPALAGGRALVVTSGSMEPALPVGSVAVVRDRPVTAIAAGDIVTFADADAGGRLVTHRVIAVEQGPDGPLLRTKGDANHDPDPGMVAGDAVRGVYWYQVPWVGTVTGFLTSAAGLLYGAAALLLLLTAHLLLPATSTRRR